MAAWIHVLKTALPHISKLAVLAVPAFTARRDADTAQQIEELQTAVRGNAEGVKTLAGELEKTVQALDAAGGDIKQTLDQYEKRLLHLQATIKQLRALAIVSALIALAALAAAINLLLSRPEYAPSLISLF